MNMKSKAGMMALALASMASNMGGGFPHDNQREFNPPQKTPIKPKLVGIKHIGAIPKNCQMTYAEMHFQKDGYNFMLEVEILASTNGGMMKKYNRLRKEVLGYINNVPLQDILDDKRFKVVENVEEVEVSGLEG